jgi:hypothetical protein
MPVVSKNKPLEWSKRARARAALVGRHRLAVLEADLPAVQRAGHRLAVHDALRQRPALVRAFVVQAEDLSSAVRKMAMSPWLDATTRLPSGAMSSSAQTRIQSLMTPPPLP